jgi:hypothetical protein
MDKKLNSLLGNLTDEEITEISDIELECPIDELIIRRIQLSSFKKAGLKNETETPQISQRKVSTWKKVTAAAACLIIALTVLTTTGTAKYLAGLWTSRINLGDGSRDIILNKKVGLIHIKEDASKKDLAEITLKQAEYMLGIDLLDSSMYSKDVLYYTPLILDRDIERVDLWYPFCLGSEESDKYISGDFMLLTDKATEHVIPDQDIDATGQKELSRTYKSTALNTTVVIYGVKWSKARLTAVFDYKNIHYMFIGNNVSETEMIDFIESLK